MRDPGASAFYRVHVRPGRVAIPMPLEEIEERPFRHGGLAEIAIHGADHRLREEAIALLCEPPDPSQSAFFATASA